MKTYAANSGGECILQVDDTSLVINSRTSMSILRDPFIKIDTSGNLIWLNRYQSPSISGFPVIICKDNQNNIQKVGGINSNITYTEISPSGSQLILRPYLSSGFYATYANVIKNSNDGGFIIVGTSSIGPEINQKYDALIYKTDSNGITPNLVSIKSNLELNISEYKLIQNYPNPFNSTTTIRFKIPKNDFVKIKIFNASGKEVATLVNNEFLSGEYLINFNAEGLPTGIYFYQLVINDVLVETKKMLLLK